MLCVFNDTSWVKSDTFDSRDPLMKGNQLPYVWCVIKRINMNLKLICNGIFIMSAKQKLQFTQFSFKLQPQANMEWKCK